MIDYSKYKDADLISLLREPKPTCDIAFNEIYQRYSKQLNAYCTFRIYVSKQTEDILQDTWEAFDKAAKKGKPVTNVHSYLIGIARKLINDYLKEHLQKNKTFINIDGIKLDRFISTYNFQQAVENDELMSIVNLAIDNLEEPYREIYILKNISGLTYAEIAGLTNNNVDCVRRLFSKATKKVLEILKPYIEELKK